MSDQFNFKEFYTHTQMRDVMDTPVMDTPVHI